jgi:DNA (cytosine-5)-methyltransferase 1
MNKRKHLDLCSGIGGFALACSWLECIETIGFAEIDNFCCEILAKNFDFSIPNFGNIDNLLNPFEYEEIEKMQPGLWLITAGFPCQPFSTTGQRKGKSDERHIWPKVCAICERFKPTWFIGENVPGIISLELDNCITNLERIGYSVQTFCIPACAVGAQHRRDRIWIVSYSMRQRKTTNWIKKKINFESNSASKIPRFDGIPIKDFKYTNERLSNCVGENDGIPSELDKSRMHALGNAIVPQVAYELIRFMLLSEQQ